MNRIIRWARRFVQWLYINRDLNILIGIPVLLLFLDLTLRVMMHLDLVDVGADLALLSVSALVSSLAETSRSQDIAVKVALLLLFIFFWLICLSFTSTFFVMMSVSIRFFIALGFGLMSLILASIFIFVLARFPVGSSDIQ